MALAKSNLLDKVGGEKGAAVKELLGNENKTDAISNIISGKKKTTEATPTEPAEDAAAAAPVEKPKSLEEQAKEKAEKKLKKLLKF
jgi:AsmA protein